MNFVDTHCHIHFPDYALDPEQVIADAATEGVTKLLAVGCTLADSTLAIEMAERHKNIWASVGLHPHEAKHYINEHEKLQQFRNLIVGDNKVVAVGECGLDYHYMHSSKQDQQKLFRFQLDLAQEHNLPLIFHVREAFDDFWHILDEYTGLTGVVHSFSASRTDLDQILSRGLYVGLNGIMTFTKDSQQLEAAKAVPLDKILLETDAPFLTPTPYRGTICEPKHVRVTAEFVANQRGLELEQITAATTMNAKQLFGVV